MSSSTSCRRNKSVSNVRHFEPWPVATDTRFFLLPFSSNITRDFIITMLLNASVIRRTSSGVREIRFVRGATYLLCLCSASINVNKSNTTNEKKIKLPKSLLSVLHSIHTAAFIAYIRCSNKLIETEINHKNEAKSCLTFSIRFLMKWANPKRVQPYTAKWHSQKSVCRTLLSLLGIHSCELHFVVSSLAVISYIIIFFSSTFTFSFVDFCKEQLFFIQLSAFKCNFAIYLAILYGRHEKGTNNYAKSTRNAQKQ